jgi:hypothetical protein
LRNQKINFKYEIGENIVNEKKNIRIVNRYFESKEAIKNGKVYIQNLKYYDYCCNNCGYINRHILEKCLYSRNQGCACCSHRTVVTGINDITTTDPWMIPYFLGEYEEAKQYMAHSNKKILMKCPDCGKTKMIKIYQLKQMHSISCYCNDGFSFPEKFFLSLLDQTNLEYEFQKKFDWCVFYNPYNNKEVTGRYDFYIKSLNLIVETDGGWHKKDNTLSGQSKEESIFIDREKDKLALINGIDIVRIDCSVSSKYYIVNSLKHSILNKYLDLSNIDYEKCNAYAMHNLKRCVIEEYKNNKRLVSTDLSKKYKISSSTICMWLREEGLSSKSRADNRLRKKSNIYAMKQVRISEDGINYRTYKSVVELAENFEKDFGDKCSYGGIWYCIRNNKKYKGRIVEYVA